VSARRFDGRVAFVTGAARGLGEAIAHAFVEAGARVALADADPAVHATAARIDPPGSHTLAVRFDVRDEPAFAAAFDDAVARFGAVDAMVNDAAITAGGSPWTLSLADWDAVMAVNLRGNFVGCRIAGAHMRGRGRGRIVNLSSYAGLHPSRASGLHYAASKAGILAVTRGFAMELAPYGVTVNAVAPSAIEGPQLGAIDAARREALLAEVPVGRFGGADEVAAAVLSLASDAAGYVTGETIELNGGRAMR
jgi:3-oxoacyl-[acyl-carrier protein] reductase